MNNPHLSNQPNSLSAAGRIGERMAAGVQRVLAATAIHDLAQIRHEYTLRSVMLTESRPDAPQPSIVDNANPTENQ